jgi:hypothetical protein
LFDLFRRPRLLLDVAVVVAFAIVAHSEKVRSFFERHFTHRAALIFDIEITGDICRVRLMLDHYATTFADSLNSHSIVEPSLVSPAAMAGVMPSVMSGRQKLYHGRKTGQVRD